MNKTLTQYLLEHLVTHPNQKDLTLIMNDLATIGKIISQKTNKAGLTNITQTIENINVQEEEQKTLDVFANDLCKNYLKQTGHFAALASEEEETVVDMGDYGKSANYVIAFDPLDGSSNIDVNVAIGTIFSVYKKREDIPRTDERQFLRKGSEQVLAGYILYSASTVLVFSFGDGVHEFTLDPGIGTFFLSCERMMIPDKCKDFSTNSTYINYLQKKDKNFIKYIRDEVGASDRHVGSLVADFHRNLIHGGVYMYFANNKKDQKIYKPKIRMVYEIQPLCFLVDQAGGAGTDGKTNILEKTPQKLHERSAIVMGNHDVVDYYKNL